MAGKTLAIVLAAGKGTRMRSRLPKVMHPVGGLPMIEHVLAAAAAAGVSRTAVVAGPDSTWSASLSGTPQVFVQENPQGTAHAVLAARDAFTEDLDAVVVLFADSPLVTPASIERALAAVAAGADLTVVAFPADDPTGYGRVLTEGDQVVAIREESEASPEERTVTLCNSGIMAIRAGLPLSTIDEIGTDNAKGEYYLTDLVELGRRKNFTMAVTEAAADEVMGVNDRAQLAEAEALFQDRARRAAMQHATLEAPGTVFFSHDTVLGEDVYVEPNVVFAPGVTVAAGARIRSFTYIEASKVGEGAIVGPFARLRPGADVGEKARVGNFVELKNMRLGPGAKVNHLSYVGDADVGKGANLGAGTITCNYDGVHKYRTEIGEGAFVGSNSALVAPIRIGERAYIGSGSVVTDDVPDDSLAIARGRQVNKPDRSPLRRKDD